jgi:hypothetical protein
MSQDQIGYAIKEAFRFLKPIFADTARLMSIVDERMKRHKLTSLWGAASAWGRSTAYYGDYGWITRYLNRLFVRSPKKNAKPSFKEKKGAFVNVYFEPELVDQPIVVYGAIKSNDENIWPSWQSLLAVNNGPQFVTSEKVNEWAEYEEIRDPIVFFKVVPLVDINNQKAVESMCDEAVEKFLRIEP